MSATACHLLTGVDDFQKASTSAGATSSGNSTGGGAAGTSSSAGGAGASEVGKPCNSNAACTSGFCVEGVCCDAACEEGCSSCLEKHTAEGDGVCAPVLLGTDPKMSCPSEAGGCATGTLCCSQGVAPKTSTCPAECSGGCDGGRCTIQCDDSKMCSDNPPVCPADMDCELVCSADKSCSGVKLVCPPETSCRIRCGNNGACQGLEVQCGNGPCTLVCENEESCSNKVENKFAVLNCGPNRCEVVANSAIVPKVNDCDASCSCLVPDSN